MFSFLLFITGLFLFSLSANTDLKKVISELNKMLQKEYYSSSKEFKAFPPQFYQRKGLYKSNIHLNFFGNAEYDEIRRLFKIPDSNQFVTNFIDVLLLEMYELGYDYIDRSRFKDSIEALLSFQDKMYPEGTPIYRFWGVVEVNGTWVSYPQNLVEPMKVFPSLFHYLEWVLDVLGLHVIEKDVEFIAKMLKNTGEAFHIPSDTDDSFVNVALLSLLHKFGEEFSEEKEIFDHGNQYFETLFSETVAHSWKPFKNSTNNHDDLDDVIDPRTYMFGHSFLKYKVDKGEKTLLLPTTWVDSIERCRKEFGLIAMPFNVNNVDANVIANFLFGATYFFLHYPGSEKYFSEDVKLMYKSVVEYIDFVTQTERIEDRSDIGLTYYPSLYDFYWFVTRVAFLLENFKEELPFEEMKEAKEILLSLTKTKLTDLILKKAQKKDDWTFWDGFLGNYEGKHFGEDRLFSTGLALNALVDTWTVLNGNGRRQWRNDVPAEVKENVDRGILFTVETYSSGYQTNAFFSGSGKGIDSLPFWYPANFYQFLNYSTPFTDWPPTAKDKLILDSEGDVMICGMKGYVEDEEYLQWQELQFFGRDVPQNNTGYDHIFPFWSSVGLSLAIEMTALAKYDSISN